jgi:hypothetical protein
LKVFQNRQDSSITEAIDNDLYVMMRCVILKQHLDGSYGIKRDIITKFIAQT